MDVSVCIVNWNTRELLFNCIDSIQKKTSGVSFEIIVVDNNSHDGSVEMIKQHYPYCKLIASKENMGFSRGNNAGLKEASGKYIIFLNPDTMLATNALFGMFQFMENDRDVGAVGCKLLNQDGSIQLICARTFPTLWNQFCYLMLLNRLFPMSKLFGTIEMGYWNHIDSRDVDCLSGACIFARKQIIEKLKGFDDMFFMYAEDVDLCYRIGKEGWRLYYLANEAIYHLEGQSSKQKTQKFFSIIAQRDSTQYFFLKHFGKAQAYLYKLITCVGSIYRLLLIIFGSIIINKDKMNKNNGRFVLLKYTNLLLWSLGLRRLHDS
jgi:O-antigen biosynthesis protein